MGPARPPLTPDAVARIQRERRAPRWTQWDYLHLRTLRDALVSALAQLDRSAGPVLDLYCGTQPYRPFVPGSPIWGYDIDMRFGTADVLGSAPLPFRDHAFVVVLCTQALYLLDDDEQAVREMGRVLGPRGTAIVTAPVLFRKERRAERRYQRGDLEALFRQWGEVQLVGFGGVGTGAAYYVGKVCDGIGRRWRLFRRIMPAIATILSALGTLGDALTRPAARRWPSGWVVIARRPDLASTSRAG